MYTVTINWYENYCQIDEGSDFYDNLKNHFPIQNKSEEEVEELIYSIIDGLAYNHYGRFSQQTEIKHIIIL